MLNHVQLFATPWTIAHQAPLSMEFSRQEYWSRLPRPSHIYVCVLVTQSCPTLCDPMDCNLPGSSVHGILQTRILEWVAIYFSRRFSWPRNLLHGRQIVYQLSYKGSPNSFVIKLIQRFAIFSVSFAYDTASLIQNGGSIIQHGVINFCQQSGFSKA